MKYENASRVQESIQKSESLLRDPDMATEMVDFVKQQIIQQGEQLLIKNTNENVRAVLNLFN
jgi:flagellin